MAGKRWSLEELHSLRARLERGQTPYMISRALDRTVSAVHTQMTRQGWWEIARYMEGLTAQQVGEIFRAHHITVRNWIRNHYIKAQILKHSKRRWYLIDMQSVIEFIENPDYWMLWDPERLTDPELKRYALEIRQQAGWSWLTIEEVAKRLCVERNAVQGRLKRGWYPTAKKMIQHWWIPSHLIPDTTVLMTPTEVSLLIGCVSHTIRKRCRKGYYKTARKIGPEWYIDRTEVLLHQAEKGVH